jgi:uncharacterized SAM-dependent methyltransferase
MKKIEFINKEVLEEKFYECLKEKRMPDCFLYLGEAGVKRWISLDRSEKFPVAAQLTELLRDNRQSIVSHMTPGMNIVSIGVGSGEKERILLEELARRDRPTYYPVDVSSQMVDTAMETVHDLPVEKVGLVGFFEDMPVLKRCWHSPVMLCMLGNSFCNYEPDEILASMQDNLHDKDLFLFDCHLFPPSEDEEAARMSIEGIYRSEKNARFNMGPLLERGMAPGAFEFQLDLLPTETSFGYIYKTHKKLCVCKDGVIQCGPGAINLKAGDTIQLGFTYKYKRKQIEDLLKQQKFDLLKVFLSDDHSNLLALVRKKSK